MDKQINQALSFIKKNPLTMAVIGIAVILTISVVAYSQSHTSSMQRKQVEAETKLASQIDDSKKTNGERVAKVAAEKKSAEEAAAKKAAEEKAAAEAAAKAEAEKQKAYTYTETEKKKEEKSYETVSVSLVRSGASVVATIGSAKEGTCFFGFKQYDSNRNKVDGTETSAPTSGGSCSSTIPAGVWTHAYVSYKANDYSAKGSSDKIAL